MQNWVRRRSHLLNLCDAHGLNTWGQLPNLLKKKQQNSVLCGELRILRCPGFFHRLVLHALPHERLLHLYRRTMKISMCPVTTRSENMSEQAQGDLLQTQSQDDEQVQETRYRLNCHEERCNRKRIHSLPERPKLRNAGGPELLDSMQETHRWSHTSSSKIWENW